MTELVLDTGRSQIRLRTYAEGFFSRLAHDLELVCGGVGGRATQRGPSDGTATIELPVGRLAIAGTLRDGELDPHGLSASDRQACLEKMRRDVFRSATDGSVVVDVTLDAGIARARVRAPALTSLDVTLRHEISAGTKGEVRVVGSASLSLTELGIGVVRGPMNAFRLRDRIDVLFDVWFEPPPT